MAEQIDTVVIGAGQAGLSTSYYLTQQQREHIVLEKQQIGNAWRSAKWDSFTLVTPNWTLQLPGFPYNGDNPDGFLTRDEIIQYLDDYTALFNPPVNTGVEVKCVEGLGDKFNIKTSSGEFVATNVVIAVGLFQQPRIPPYSSQIAPHIYQVHSSQYRHPQELPEGAVLIVGAGQSGCQIADELQKQGTKVYLCTGRANYLPRRYRGRDIFWWAKQMGVLDQPVTQLPSPAARFIANPQLTGKDGGQTLNLHQLAFNGVTLLGRLRDARGTTIAIAEDLIENLTQADQFVTEFIQEIDQFTAQMGITAPPDDRPTGSSGYDSQIITALDLDTAGITSVIWTTGYAFDFSWIKFPIFDEFGYPFQQRGVTTQTGLYFVGLPWLYVAQSSLLAGVGDDAAHVVQHLINRTNGN